MKKSSVFQNLVDIVVAPAEAMRRIRTNPVSWLPLVLLLGGWIVFWNWYFGAVDYPWLIDHMTTNEVAKAAPDQQEAVRQGIAKLKPGALSILSSLLVIVVLMVVTVLTSGYLVVVSAIKGFDEFRFKHWFSLSLWVTVPSLFSILAMILNFFFGPAGRTAPERLNPLSFNNLLAVPVSSPFSQVLNSLDLVTVWTWALLALGFRQWTGSSWLQSAIVVLAPVAVIYGSWGLIAWL